MCEKAIHRVIGAGASPLCRASCAKMAIAIAEPTSHTALATAMASVRCCSCSSASAFNLPSHAHECEMNRSILVAGCDLSYNAVAARSDSSELALARSGSVSTDMSEMYQRCSRCRRQTDRTEPGTLGRASFLDERTPLGRLARLQGETPSATSIEFSSTSAPRVRRLVLDPARTGVDVLLRLRKMSRARVMSVGGS